MVTLLYFAWIREKVGLGEEQVELPQGVSDAGALIDWLSTRSAGHAAALADRDRLRIAIDQSFAGPEAPIEGAREIAIFPPVTGG